MKYNIKWLIILHIVLLLYAVSAMFSKLAAGSELYSIACLAFYGAAVIMLVLYALGWQQIIKHIPLTTAYANKSVTVIWGMILGILVFNETISVRQMIGAALIIVGILLYVNSDRRNVDDKC